MNDLVALLTWRRAEISIVELGQSNMPIPTPLGSTLADNLDSSFAALEQ